MDITEKEIGDYFRLNEQYSRLKKQREILGDRIKENILPGMKKLFGEYLVSVSISGRMILDSKKLKEDYPKIYETYGKEQEVKTLRVVEIGS
jgi:predicted phage-related endonuclease